MPKDPKAPPEPPVDRDHVDAGRRRFFRLFFKPMAAAVSGYQLPPNHTSTNPPVERPVIRPGPGNTLVLALIQPLVVGGANAAGFTFHGAQVSETEMRYTFVCGPEWVDVVFAQPGTRTGYVVGATKTFAVFAEGTAAPAVVDAVGRVVLMHASERDFGQLWTTAARAVASKQG